MYLELTKVTLSSPQVFRHTKGINSRKKPNTKS